MDESGGKRVIGGLGIAKSGPNLSFRNQNNDSRSFQCCNRQRCNTRVNPMKGTQLEYSEKAKPSKPGLHSSSSKAIVGSSSKLFSTDLKKSHQEQPNTLFSMEPDLAASSSREESIAITEPISTTAEFHAGTPETEDKESASLHGFSESDTVLEEVGNYTVAQNPRAKKQLNEDSGLESQDTSTSSSVRDSGFRRSFASRNTNQAAKSGTQGPSASSHRYGLSNLSCASISDVLPSGCSSSDYGRKRRADVMKKRAFDGESSSARGKSMSGPSSIGMSNSLRGPISSRSNSFQANSSSTPSARETRNFPASRDGAYSVRTRRTAIGDTRTMLSELGQANILSQPEPVMISPLTQTDLSTDESNLASTSGSVSTELPSIFMNSYGCIDSSKEPARRRGMTHLDDTSRRSFRGISIDRESYRHFNMEQIAEVLLALDRIGDDEELTYEQLLIAETSLLLSGFSAHDQHRDMRLNIDNMSYEELLALEEKMGSVSTALTEEALSNCLRRSCYNSDPSTSEFVGSRDVDDVKCSICQEEYVVGDGVGKLHCEHCFHMDCIQHWLRQKNWCPICKASASPS